MKANELMIGDWVETPDYVTRVETIGPTAVLCEGIVRWLAIQEVQPVPLTPEILEKNGWNEWYMYYHLPIDQQQQMQYYPHEGILRRYYTHKNGNMEQVFEVHAINYVHELQHALRLCGIDKEIVL